MEHSCYICDKRVVVEGEGPLHLLCDNCHTRSRDAEFVRRTLEDLPCLKLHCTGKLRARIPEGQVVASSYACSRCDLNSREETAILALLVEQVNDRAGKADDIRQRRYHRWIEFREAMLSDEDRRLLRPPGISMPSPYTIPPIGRTRGDMAEYDLRRDDWAPRVQPPKKK